MHYQISRGGQMYGPYTLDDLQRYLGTGNVLPTDLAKSDDMPDWVTVSTLLAAPAAAPVMPVAPPQTVYTGYAPQTYVDPALQPVAVNPALVNSPYEDAPNLHWGLVLLFCIVTGSLFNYVWDIVIALWLRRVQPTDRSLLYYVGAVVLRVLKWTLSLFLGGWALGRFGDVNVSSRHLLGFGSLDSVLFWGILGLIIAGNFIKRASLLDHFNGPENVGLELSGAMTFFFAPVYFQYHLNKINAMKQAARYGAARAF